MHFVLGNGQGISNSLDFSTVLPYSDEEMAFLF